MPLTFAQLDRRAALETVDRADLKEWQSYMATKLSDFLRAEYLKTDFSRIGDLDRTSLHGELMDAISNATFEAWEKME